MPKGRKKQGRSAVSKPADTAVVPTEPVSANEQIIRKMKDLVLSQFLNPKYSDLSISCGDEVFPAHRNILCPQSKYFEVVCSSRFKESNGEIIIENCNPVLIKKTLVFLYTGDYTYDGAPITQAHLNSKNSSESSPETWAENNFELDADTEQYPNPSRKTNSTDSQNCQAFFHAQMYAQGDYFQINELKKKAKDYFMKSFLEHPDQDSFSSSVVEVYSSTGEHDRGLRDLVVQLTTDNLKILRNGDNPILCDGLLESVPKFMLEVCLSTLDKCAEYQRQRYGYY
ncbi:BTB/POZ domain-containing protein [Aspergillus niger CBS 101883]|uniref:BTB/POZ domain-containing protein n=1 Tax=Aspergillus lacticoffeatus (strain CBS 101883) TaxID=1450533 RepID=UPI000D7F8865|nr:BTB/POZ domain protein [Aspergillus niger CBS 101883]PYH50899.1 BTB/POZ domain protein [Aspergillus niger CBS 101883]